RGRPLARLPPGVAPVARRRRRLLLRALGRVPAPDDDPVDVRDALLLDDARAGGVRPLHDDRAAAVGSPRLVEADAGLGADAGVVPALQVRVLLPDREPRRQPLDGRAPARARPAAAVDRARP